MLPAVTETKECASLSGTEILWSEAAPLRCAGSVNMSGVGSSHWAAPPEERVPDHKRGSR